MVFFILKLVALLILSMLFSSLSLGIMCLSLEELKQKAIQGDNMAKKVYPIRARGTEFLISMLIGTVMLNAAITSLLDTKLNFLAAVVISTIVIVLNSVVLPKAFFKKYGLSFGALISPFLERYLWLLSSVTRHISHFIERAAGIDQPTIYSRQELFKIFEQHRVAEFSGIEHEEIELIRRAMEFGSKKIIDVMTPLGKVDTVSSDEVIGPVLLNELHNSGKLHFLVSNSKADEIIGTLELSKLITIKDGRKVNELMDKHLHYVHSQAPLQHVLNAFSKSSKHNFLVIDEFEELLGVISIEDIIEQVLGKNPADDFVGYENKSAVASIDI